ncbi:hypothetical protein [Tepidimonas alkaliphilus]|uniref:hypothetical protein n=1 Tax=Tepidimonas alkaliphilus TaxID=2588942 RepID=UPI00117C5698|nr:hypothetical protein [Tepidimonas alkaliphilus]
MAESPQGGLSCPVQPVPLIGLAAAAAAAALVQAMWAWHRPDLPPAWWFGTAACVVWLAWVGWLRRRSWPVGWWVWRCEHGATEWFWQPPDRRGPVPLSDVAVRLRTPWGLLLQAQTQHDGAQRWWWCVAGPQARELKRALQQAAPSTPSAIVGPRLRP